MVFGVKYQQLIYLPNRLLISFVVDFFVLLLLVELLSKFDILAAAFLPVQSYSSQSGYPLPVQSYGSQLVYPLAVGVLYGK